MCQEQTFIKVEVRESIFFLTIDAFIFDKHDLRWPILKLDKGIFG